MLVADRFRKDAPMSPESARLRPDDAHDILAAEEFPVPAGHEDHKLDRVVVLGLGARLAAALAGLSIAVAIVLHRGGK